MLASILRESTRIQVEWAEALAAYIRTHARGGFRWHVSGDVVSMDHAEWIAEVCLASPEVRSWIYTRSFDFLEPLREVSTTRGGNLALNLSADGENVFEAINAAVDPIGYSYPPLRICYLVDDDTRPRPVLAEGSVFFPDYKLRGVGASPSEMRASSPLWDSLEGFERRGLCPVDFYGANEGRRCGPCGRCL